MTDAAAGLYPPVAVSAPSRPPTLKTPEVLRYGRTVNELHDEFDAKALAVGLETFGGDKAERRAVARHARDMADSGRYEADADVLLTPEHVVVQLADAPDGSPAERWNWWVGALEFAYGGYAEFRVRRLRK